MCEVKKYKYYSVSLDSTPNISNVDQLTLIVGYDLPSGPLKRFVKFLDMEGHSVEQLTQGLLDFIRKMTLIKKTVMVRVMSMPRTWVASIMDYKHKLRELNEFAEYIPCFAHSLILVGKCLLNAVKKHWFSLNLLKKWTIFFSFYLLVGSPFCCIIWWWHTFAHCKKECHIPGVELMQMWQKHLYTAFLQYNKSLLTFQMQWSEGRVSSTGSWTTFNHNKAGNRNNGHIVGSIITAFSNDQCFFAIFWLRLEHGLCTL